MSAEDEFGPGVWRTSSYSGSGGGQCVEVAVTATAVGVRDSKDRAGGYFTVDRSRWAAFVDRIRDGSLDD